MQEIAPNKSYTIQEIKFETDFLRNLMNSVVFELLLQPMEVERSLTMIRTTI